MTGTSQVISMADQSEYADIYGKLRLDPTPFVIRVPHLISVKLRKLCRQRSEKTLFIRESIAEKLYRGQHLSSTEIELLRTNELLED